MHWAKKLDAGMQKLNQVLIFISCIFLGILVMPLKKAAALAAEIHGVKKNALYKYALEQQGE